MLLLPSEPKQEDTQRSSVVNCPLSIDKQTSIDCDLHRAPLQPLMWQQWLNVHRSSDSGMGISTRGHHHGCTSEIIDHPIDRTILQHSSKPVDTDNRGERLVRCAEHLSEVADRLINFLISNKDVPVDSTASTGYPLVDRGVLAKNEHHCLSSNNTKHVQTDNNEQSMIHVSSIENSTQTHVPSSDGAFKRYECPPLKEPFLVKCRQCCGNRERVRYSLQFSPQPVHDYGGGMDEPLHHVRTHRNANHLMSGLCQTQDFDYAREANLPDSLDILPNKPPIRILKCLEQPPPADTHIRPLSEPTYVRDRRRSDSRIGRCESNVCFDHSGCNHRRHPSRHFLQRLKKRSENAHPLSGLRTTALPNATVVAVRNCEPVASFKPPIVKGKEICNQGKRVNPYSAAAMHTKSNITHDDRYGEDVV
ncbi:hypothetical protein ACOME3_010108 [Neoechinorhynchus agilis]